MIPSSGYTYRSRWNLFQHCKDLYSRPFSSATPTKDEGTKRLTPHPIPASPNQSHNSLSTFLAHARHTSLSPRSTTYVGTRYEYLCLKSLRRLGFILQRTGGRSDLGIDLLGYWHLPSIPHPLPVLVQCKALKARAGPNLVRELEGAFAGAPVGWRAQDRAVGVLCATREATKGVREAVKRLGRPVVWIMIRDDENVADEVDDKREHRGMITQVLWNQKTSEAGAEGLGVQVRYLGGMQGIENGQQKEVVLTWDGKVWEPESTGFDKA